MSREDGMPQRERIERVIASRRHLGATFQLGFPLRKAEAEGGCGVIGIACSEPVAGRHLLRALDQMRNRGNGKGGGVALVGLAPEEFGVTHQILREDYLLAIAYLDPSARSTGERDHIGPSFSVDHVVRLPREEASGLPIQPPEVVAYFIRVPSRQ